MGALSAATVRQRVTQAIAAAMGASGWRETTGVYDTFGQGDGENRLHQSFAVGVPSTAVLSDGRQRASTGVLTQTTVRVRIGFNLAALDQITSYDEALEGADDIRAAVNGSARSNSLHIVYQRESRSVDDQGWMVIDQEYLAIHHTPLTT